MNNNEINNIELQENELNEVAGGKGYVRYIKYKVVKGDSLWNLAKKYGTTVDAICAANVGKIIDPDIIKIGWIINIPVKY